MNSCLINGDRRDFIGQTCVLPFCDIENHIFKINLTFEERLGVGSSCVTYAVKAQILPGEPAIRCILKQFYPDPVLYEVEEDLDDNFRLTIRGAAFKKNIETLENRFEETWRRQVYLSNEPDLAGHTVRPWLSYFDGTTKYIISEQDYGEILKPENYTSEFDFLKIMNKLANTLAKLHEHRLVYMDLRPDNILVTPDGDVKLFDFDASVDLEHLKEVHLNEGVQSLRYGNEEGLIAPEIRPAGLLDFENSKFSLLTPAVDVYAFGSILFHYYLGRYPSVSDLSDKAYIEELKSIFRTGKYRCDLTSNEEDALIDIIEKCISETICYEGPQRYVSATELHHDLDGLIQMFDIQHSHSVEKENEDDRYLEAACLLDENPLCRWIKRNKSGEKVMKAVLLGDDAVNQDFLSIILSTAYITDVRLIIHIACTDADKQMTQYLQQWPLMKKTVNLFLDGVKQEITTDGKPISLDTEIADTFMSEIYFHSWDRESDGLPQLFQSLRIENVSWIAVCDTKTDQNMTDAETIASMISYSEDSCTFITYLDTRGDGYDVRQAMPRNDGVVMRPFSYFRVPDQEGKKGASESRLMQKVRFKHNFSASESDKCSGTVNHALENPYNRRSSIASVLAIPYKLSAVGVTISNNRKAADAYMQALGMSDESICLPPIGETAIEEKKKLTTKQQANYNRLLYLEHLHWIGYMMTEGYDRPSWEQVRSYAFRNGNNQRNKKEKLHICIVKSNPDSGICLNRIPKELWDDKNYRSRALGLGIELDELDCMSIHLHQLLNDRIQQMQNREEFQNVYTEIENAFLSGSEFSDEDNKKFISLKIFAEKMIRNESNINALWRKECTQFSEYLLVKKKSDPFITEEISKAFDHLKQLMEPVIARNSYRDFKKSDASILNTVPLTMIFDRPVKRILKPASPETWKNVITSIYLEPEELWLVSQHPDCIDGISAQKFLAERGIHTRVSVQPMEKLCYMREDNRQVNSVLDITGDDLNLDNILRRFDRIRHFPVIYFSDGHIHTLVNGFHNGTGEKMGLWRENDHADSHYYEYLEHHISVEDTFRLHGAKIYTDRLQNYVLDLNGYYQKLWDAYLNIEPGIFRILVKCLNSYEKFHYHRLYSSNKSADVMTITSPEAVDGSRTDVASLRKMFIGLEEDTKNHWIELGYHVPARYENGIIEVKSHNKDIAEILDKVFHKQLLSGKQGNQFTFLTTRREPMTGRPLSDPAYYIYDNSLTASFWINEKILQDENITNVDAKKNLADKINQCLRAFANRDLIYQNGEYAFCQYNEYQDHIYINLRYKNEAIRQSLMREGNMLEVFAYFSLWKRVTADDIQNNVGFIWNTDTEESLYDSTAITNELDLVCTKNMRTYFISCKQTVPETAHLQEIQSIANQFGINAVPILITSSKINPASMSNLSLIKNRAAQMGVYLIDREMLGDNMQEMENRLAHYMENIFLGKKNWIALT